MKGGIVRRNKRNLRSRKNYSRRIRAAMILAAILIASVAAISLLPGVRAAAPERIPSYVEWTQETIETASSGDAFRGMLLARRCEHCHGAEGFSAVGWTPNLASVNKLAIWKQLEDFRSRKRQSRVMEPIADTLSARDVADVAAYYAELPVFPDPQDNRVFPQPQIAAAHLEAASRLIAFGDGTRGIPPCQACHGPVAYKTGAPSLAMQNNEYVLNQLEAFANKTRANDIDEPMRTIATLLSEDERHALAEYYGAGLGLQPGGAK
jgi:cytochrome c553